MEKEPFEKKNLLRKESFEKRSLWEKESFEKKNPLFRIYLDMLNVYKVMSENITAAITHNGEQVWDNMFWWTSVLTKFVMLFWRCAWFRWRSSPWSSRCEWWRKRRLSWLQTGSSAQTTHRCEWVLFNFYYDYLYTLFIATFIAMICIHNW